MEGTRKVSAEFGLLALILLTGLILASPVLLLLALPIAVHVTLGLILTTENQNLRARRSLSSHRIRDGDSVEVELTLERTGKGPDLALISEERSLAGHIIEGEPSAAEHLTRGRSLVLSYVAQPPRGFYPLEEAHLSARDMLGFQTWEGCLPCPTPLWVLPRYETIGRLKLSPRRTLPVPGTARSRRGGVGVQFFGTRPYIPGDDRRRINWKTLALRDQIVVNLYEEERAAEVTVVLDGRDRAYQLAGGRDLFERTVSACAAICDSAIRDGHRTGLLLYGERLEWVFLGGGRVHSERILQTLAKADIGFSAAFADLGNLPAKLFPSGSSIIIVSPFAQGDEQALGILRARGYDVLALVPDPFTLIREQRPGTDGCENGILRTDQTETAVELATRLVSLERAVILRLLASTGVRVAMWDVNSPLGWLIKAAWRRNR